MLRDHHPVPQGHQNHWHEHPHFSSRNLLLLPLPPNILIRRSPELKAARGFLRGQQESGHHLWGWQSRPRQVTPLRNSQLDPKKRKNLAAYPNYLHWRS